MFRRLVPKLHRLRIPRDRIENENLVGRKAGGLIRQAFERSDEKSGYEQHQKTKRHLHGDQHVHQPALRMRVFSALKSASWIDGRCAQGGH